MSQVSQLGQGMFGVHKITETCLFALKHSFPPDLLFSMRWNFYHKAFSVFKTDSYLSKTGEGTKLCITGVERRSRLMSHRATELDSSQAAISDIPWPAPDDQVSTFLQSECNQPSLSLHKDICRDSPQYYISQKRNIWLKVKNNRLRFPCRSEN